LQLPSRGAETTGHICWNEYVRLLDGSDTVDVLALVDAVAAQRRTSIARASGAPVECAGLY